MILRWLTGWSLDTVTAVAAVLYVTRQSLLDCAAIRRRRRTSVFTGSDRP